MNKIVTSLVILGLILIPVIAYAQESQEAAPPSAMSEGSSDYDFHQGMKPRPPMGGNMMGMMMAKSMVATPDGGVIVLAGKKLQKYDQDLNLKKEVDIKLGSEDMMPPSGKMCPISQSQMEGTSRSQKE